MLFTPLILLFPAVSHASWLPFRRGQASNPEDCTLTSTLAPITVTSIYPTSTFSPNGEGSGGSGHGQVTGGGGTLIYTTALPTLGPEGPGVHTYTVTSPCASSHCERPPSTECPPGFTTTVVICHVCGEHPVTTTLTLPIDSATANQGFHGGAAKDSSTLTVAVPAASHKPVTPVSPAESLYPWVSRGGPELPGYEKPSKVPDGPGSEHDGADGAEKGDELPAGPKNTGSPESLAGADTSTQTGQAGLEDGNETGAKPASPSPSVVVVTGHASESKVTRSVVLKAVLFAAMVLYPLYA